MDDVTGNETIIAIGAARHLPHDIGIDVGPLHPAGHPGIQIAAQVEGDLVVSADARIGLMHRSAEKLFEARDYRQLMMLANRHDWLSAFSSELCIALALEDAMGIAPPERATWSRTLLAEYNRITAALMMVGASIAPAALDFRERLVALQEQATGGRVHPMFVRIGGLSGGLQPGWLEAVRDELGRLGAAWNDLMADAADATRRLAGIGRLTPSDAIDLGATGAVGWASGVGIDLRRDQPYLAYAELEQELPATTFGGGDIPARYHALMAQIPASLRLIDRCMDRLGALGDERVDVPLPKVVRVPEGTTYAQIEGPLGVAGVLLVSTGDRTPWRLKLRTPSLVNIQALARALPGSRIDQVADITRSFFFVIGDADR